MATLIPEVCEKRMVECSQEQYETAKKMALEAMKRLHDYNTKVFHPLWEAWKKEEERWLSSAEAVEAWKKEKGIEDEDEDDGTV